MKIVFLSLCLAMVIACNKQQDGFANMGNSSYNHNRNVGASANDLLASKNYESLTVEILYTPGYKLTSGAAEHLTHFLETYLNKPGGIHIAQSEIPATDEVLNISQVRDVENTNRKAFTNGKNLAISLLITNGRYQENNILGIAYRNTSAALFGKTIHENAANPVTQPSRPTLEATVLEHEIGHLLGLVDIGSPMQKNHKDAAHGNHCNNQNCLMYYASETTDILGFLMNNGVPPPDANCSNDLKANGGK